MSIIRELKARYHARKARKFNSRANKCVSLTEYVIWSDKAFEEYMKMREIIRHDSGIFATDTEIFKPGGLFYNEQKMPRYTCGLGDVSMLWLGPKYVTEGMAKNFEENNKEGEDVENARS